MWREEFRAEIRNEWALCQQTSLSVPSAGIEAQWGVLHHMVNQNSQKLQRNFGVFFSSNAEAIWEINAGSLGDPPRDNVQPSNGSMLFFSHDRVFPGWIVQGPRLEKQKMHAAHRGGIPLSKTVLCSLVPLTLNLFCDSFDLDVTQSGCQKKTSFFWKRSQLELCYWSVAVVSQVFVPSETL